MSYNVTDNVNDSFDFFVEGKKFTMDYPLMADLENLQDVAEKQKEAERNGDLSLAKEYAKEVENFIFGFIHPSDGGDEDIKTVMKRQNIKAMRNFNIIIKTELGVE